MHLCDYGCGREGIYYFKTAKKWCCSESHNSCPARRKYMSVSRKGKDHPLYGKEGFWKDKKRPEQSKIMRGKNHPLYGKKRSKITKKKISNSHTGRKDSKETCLKKSTGHKRTIDGIKKIHPLFFRIEEMRYNPDKPIEKRVIQVHCKHNKCPNSKEQGGWFTPTTRQIEQRCFHIEYGNGGSYFYCSEKCKQECPLYGLRSDPFKNNELPYTQEEYNIWKQQVLEQDKYECQKCGSKEKLHCHHIIPVKLEPMFALDPDNGIVLCQECHYKCGHKDECSTGNLANKEC